MQHILINDSSKILFRRKLEDEIISSGKKSTFLSITILLSVADYHYIRIKLLSRSYLFDIITFSVKIHDFLFRKQQIVDFCCRNLAEIVGFNIIINIWYSYKHSIDYLTINHMFSLIYYYKIAFSSWLASRAYGG